MEASDHNQAFKDFEAAGWSANAAGYDRLTGRITAHVADALLDAAGVRSGVEVLDVGCGPGHLCGAAAARGAAPVGVDLAAGMVAAARRAHPGLTFEQGDAEALRFADDRFDAALGAFVVNHLPAPARAAAELRRVVRPGGRVALAMWGPPERVEFLGLFDAALRAAEVDGAGALPPGPPAFAFAADGALEALLADAGLDAVAAHEVTFEHAVAGAGELWDGVMVGSVRTAAQLAALDDAARDRVRAALDGLLERRRASGGLALETAVRIAVGISPGG